MAGVNKVILVGNLGADPEVALVQQRRRSGEPARRHVRELEGPRRQPPGTDRMAPCRHLQREPRPRSRRAICARAAKVYLEGQIQTRKWTDQSGNDRYIDRGRAAEFPRRAGPARQPRRRRRRRGRGAFNDDFGGDDSAAARRSVSNRARSRRRSTPTSTTTFRSRIVAVVAVRSLARTANGPACSSVITPASLSAASAPALRG